MLTYLLFACSEPEETSVVVEKDLEYIAGSEESVGDVEDRVTDRGWLYEPLKIHDFAITLSDDARASLAADPSVDVPVSFTYEGRSYEAAMHLRGNRSLRTLDGKPSLKIDFGEYDDDQTLDGVRRLTLNNMIQDGSMLRDEMAYYLFRQAGVTAPRHGYARITINEQPYGLYGVVETLDEQFLGDHFVSADGNAYEGGYGADIAPGRSALFEIEETGSIAPYEDLNMLIEAFADDEDDYLAQLGAWFDADDLLRMFAVELVSGQPDGYVSYANNFVLYYDPMATRWTMMPWGPDQSFSASANDLLIDWYGMLALQCQDDHDCRERLGEHILAVLDVWEASDMLGHVEEVRQLIAADCEADSRRELPCEEDQDDLVEYIEKRPDKVRAVLEE